ncbi:MAG: hypothetical protein JOZ15_12820, partial [Acidobacteria bacterium]|nr:hypothetical protein [Acidobacteriota bacterium]
MSRTCEDETTLAVRLLGATGAGGCGTTFKVRGPEVVAPTASVISRSKVLWPKVVAVPVILPVESIDKP